MKKEKSNAMSYDLIGGKDVMPILAFYGPRDHYWAKDLEVDPSPDMFTDEYYKTIAESGVKIIAYSNTDYEEQPDLMKKNLELASKYGLGHYVLDSALQNYAKEDPTNLEKIEKRLEEYRHYPAFCGIHVVDEPSIEGYRPCGNRDICNYAEQVDMLQKLGIRCFAAMLPLYGLYEVEGMQELYHNYLEEYCRVFNPEVLIYDHYPFTDAGATRLDIYFWNMSVVREHAKKHNLPFGVCIQAGGQWNDHLGHFDSVPYYPNQGQFEWNVNTCLAMGAKQLEYFPLIQPYHFAWAETKPFDFERNGLISLDGRKTQWYYYAQKINKHIEAIDEVLMNSANQGLVVSSEKAREDLKATNCVISNGTFEELTSVTGEALIGCFNYEGKTALYVVNYDMESEQKITLGFNQVCNVSMTKNAESSCATGETLTLGMAPGEGILVVVD